MKIEKHIEPARLLRDKQAAKLLAISVSYFWRLVQFGVIPKPSKVSPKISVWKSADIQRFIENPELLSRNKGA